MKSHCLTRFFQKNLIIRQTIQKGLKKHTRNIFLKKFPIYMRLTNLENHLKHRKLCSITFFNHKEISGEERKNTFKTVINMTPFEMNRRLIRQQGSFLTMHLL